MHDLIVRHYCFEIIGQLGTTWRARTFRDKISAKLFASGYLKKEGKKIGWCTTTYYLREIGMVLVHPKKGIYKDGHERVDAVEYRKKYTYVLNAFKDRERTYKGEHLEIEVSPVCRNIAARSDSRLPRRMYLCIPRGDNTALGS